MLEKMARLYAQHLSDLPEPVRVQLRTKRAKVMIVYPLDCGLSHYSVPFIYWSIGLVATTY